MLGYIMTLDPGLAPSGIRGDKRPLRPEKSVVKRT